MTYHMLLVEQVQKDAIDGQKAVVAQRQEDVEEARKALILANQELEALEKHNEKLIEEVKNARMSREEENMDELAQTIYTRTKAGDK